MSPIIRASIIALFAGFFIVLPASFLFAQDVGERVVKRGTINDDIYLAGGEVELLATVQGDVTVAGGQVNLEGDINGDVIAAGGSVILRSAVADDARLAGGNVQVRGAVGDDVIAAGGRVLLGPDARVGGRAWLSGGEIRVDGDVGQELRAAGGRVNITGKVRGDVFVQADEIAIGSDAVIMGQLHTKGPREARIADGARIDGEVSHTTVEVPVAPMVASLVGAGLVLLLSLIITGVVLYLIFPNFAARCTQSLRDAPWPCLGMGVAVFAATPVVILVLLVTAVGVWLALLLLAAYFILLLLGYLTGTLFVGEAGLRLIGKNDPSKAWRATGLAVALLVLTVVGLIPLLGGLIAWLVLLAGMGALMRQMSLAYKSAGS
jgi:cytoskeletal protein CcmA (bactofilin family)